MRREAVVDDIELIPLGEIRMGCDAYGVLIKTNFGEIDVFQDTPILVGQTDPAKVIEQSSCNRYVLIKGAFATYMVDIKDQSISVYRATVRGPNNEWCDENPVYGAESHHVKGFSRHYHLQFPFVHNDRFHQVFDEYEALRCRQIAAATSRAL